MKIYLRYLLVITLILVPLNVLFWAGIDLRDFSKWLLIYVFYVAIIPAPLAIHFLDEKKQTKN